jgi:GT2 family glycosyltransferase
MFHSVIIATKGRAPVVKETIENILQQDSQVDEIIVSATHASDVDGLNNSGKIKSIFGSVGLTVQRNAAIHSLDPKCTIVTFLDDDVELAPNYFQVLSNFFQYRPDIIAVGGNPQIDGCTRSEAQKCLAIIDENQESKEWLVKSLYGCNMSFRRDVIERVQFDEKLRLYGWLEDYDFSVRVSNKGPIVVLSDLKLCHLRTPTGRMNHQKFGFAQVMNPCYLVQKGTMSPKDLLKFHLFPLLIANILGVFKNPVDRLRRLQGNIKALAMIARGKIEPEAIEIINN